MPKRRKSKKKSAPTMAQQADRHLLYEHSVQCAESEIDFVLDTFKKLRGQPARLLREDFCGTANVCCEWVRRHRENRAIGVDLDPEVLYWGRENNLSKLKSTQRARVMLLERDVLTVNTDPVDVVSAMNFSYWLLKERKVLLRYFRRVRKALKDDGVFFLDCYGGYDSHREIEEEREIDDGDKGFTYIWDQADFDPVTHSVICHIHFAFPDDSYMEQAFSYDWRLWTLPEVQDLLTDAGFTKVTVYWQGWDKDGEADGDFKPVTKGVADAGWIAYLTAEK